jgi:hypothetical protein
MMGDNPRIHVSDEVSQLQLKSGQWIEIVFARDYDIERGEYNKVATAFLQVTKEGEFKIFVNEDIEVTRQLRESVNENDKRRK